jgi:hypothetical protein
VITPTFAQIDALALAPSVTEEEHRRYLAHQGLTEAYGDCDDTCRCQDDDEALFCPHPAHLRPWWLP